MIEIRVPTYKRPELLHRALSSLIDQTLQTWQAIVLEDSPENESQTVVRDLADERIEFRACSRNRGSVANLSLAYSPDAFCKGTRYACVLEDDNYYRPTYLANAVARLERFGVDVFCGNSQIAQLYEDGTEVVEERYTMSPTYGFSVRTVDIQERLRAFSGEHPISNLSIVWRLNRGIDFSVSSERYNWIAAELRRALAWPGVMVYDPAVNAVWTNFADRKSVQPPGPTHGRRWSRSVIIMNTQWVKLIKKYRVTFDTKDEETVRGRCLDSISLSALRSISGVSDVIRVARNLAIVICY